MELDKLVDKVVDELMDCTISHAKGISPPHCNWCWVCSDCRTRVVEEMVGNGANRVGAGPELGPIKKNLASLIDHTMLKADATRSQVEKLCHEAVEHGFASVCINPGWVKLCRDIVRGSGVLVCTVVGFPLGANAIETKSFETLKAIEHGADEIDMVINVGRLKSADHNFVFDDIKSVVDAAGRIGSVKVILETCYLTDEEKIKGSLLSKQAGATFVKTSTGFGTGGATLADVALMRKVVGSQLGVKASGGIRDYASAVKMVEAGATRIGASASIKMVNP